MSEKILNGDFSNGFTNWTVTDAGNNNSIAAFSGSAEFGRGQRCGPVWGQH